MANWRLGIARKVIGVAVLAAMATQVTPLSAYGCVQEGNLLYCVHDDVGRCSGVDVYGFCEFICQTEGKHAFVGWCDDVGEQLFTLHCYCIG